MRFVRWSEGKDDREFFGGAEEDIRAWDCFLVERETHTHIHKDRRRDSQQRQREGEVGRRYRKA